MPSTEELVFGYDSQAAKIQRELEASAKAVLAEAPPSQEELRAKVAKKVPLVGTVAVASPAGQQSDLSLG